MTPYGLTQTTAVGVKTKFYANILMIFQKFAPLTARKKKLAILIWDLKQCYCPMGFFGTISKSFHKLLSGRKKANGHGASRIKDVLGKSGKRNLMTSQQQPLCPKLHCCTSQPGLKDLGEQQIQLKCSGYLLAINNIGISKKQVHGGSGQ